MEINYIPTNALSLEIGDCIEFNDNVYFLVKAKNSKPELELISLNEASVYGHESFHHPVHVINHIKKHYGSYTIIKSNRVELNIQE